jgi:hypothetical protein
MRLTESGKTVIIVLTAILWVIITALGVTENGSTGLYFTVLLTACYAIIGGAYHNGNVNVTLLTFPVISWAVGQVICVAGMNYYYYLFKGVRPTFTVLGFHPSYAFVVLIFWVWSVICWGGGLYALRKTWLSNNEWDEFEKTMKAIDAKEGN